jgi:serine/threonine-protein kinase
MSQSKKEGSGTQERVKPAPPRPPKKGIGEVLQEGPHDISSSPTHPELQVPETAEEAAERLEQVLTKKFAEQGYTFIAKIGSGGMGNVFLARDDALDREVAIKVMNDDMFGNREAMARFFKEARALAKLNHPNITIIYKLHPDEKDGYSFIVQEMLNGKDMNQLRSEKGSFEPDVLQALFIQACDGFAAAHEAGIIHRDIKPENIFVIGSNGKQTVKIMDFGVAKVEDKVGASFRTQVGFIMGSMDYLSPEQAEGKKVDKRADIYSLGATMYEMATGMPPFGTDGSGTTPQAIFAELFPKIKCETPVLPSKRVPLKGIPEGLDSVIMRCLEKDPADRYQSMTELQDALRRLKIEPKPKPKAEDKPAAKPIDINLPSIVVSESIHGVEVDGRKRSAMAIEAGVVKPIPLVAAEGDEIAAGQDEAKKAGMKTLIKQFSPDKNRRMKRIATAAVISAVVGLGALTGIAIVRSGGRPVAPHIQTTSEAMADVPDSRENPTPRPVNPALVPIPPLVASVDAGAAETASAAAPEAGSAVAPVTFSISIRTTPAGVEVLDGENSLCVTEASRPCSISYGAGTDQIRLRFRKRGFTEAERTFVPDSDRTIEVSLERAPALRPGIRPPTKQGGRPGNAPPTGTGPSITSED